MIRYAEKREAWQVRVKKSAEGDESYLFVAKEDRHGNPVSEKEALSKVVQRYRHLTLDRLEMVEFKGTMGTAGIDIW